MPFWSLLLRQLLRQLVPSPSDDNSSLTLWVCQTFPDRTPNLSCSAPVITSLIAPNDRACPDPYFSSANRFYSFILFLSKNMANSLRLLQ